jgi:hypothetical protein
MYVIYFSPNKFHSKSNKHSWKKNSLLSFPWNICNLLSRYKNLSKYNGGQIILHKFCNFYSVLYPLKPSSYKYHKNTLDANHHIYLYKLFKIKGKKYIGGIMETELYRFSFKAFFAFFISISVGSIKLVVK